MELAQRKVARSNITRLINEAEQLLRENETTTYNVKILLERLDNAKHQLNRANEVWIPLMEEEKAEDEWTTIFEYEDRIVSIVAKLRFKLKELEYRENSADIRTRRKNRDLKTELTEENVTVDGEEIGNERPNVEGSHGSREASSRSSSMVFTKLPKLEIPKFDDMLENWFPFWEMFKPTIHDNEEIIDFGKFAFVLQHVTEDSKKAVENIGDGPAVDEKEEKKKIKITKYVVGCEKFSGNLEKYKIAICIVREPSFTKN